MPGQLGLLLGAFEPRAFAPGQTAIVEGEEGREAFVVVRGHLRAERGDGRVLAELGPGALFGEMALVSDAPRAASVRAVDPVQLLVASRDALEKLAKRTPELDRQLSSFCRARMLANLIRHSAILEAVPPAERAGLLERFAPRQFRDGERLLTLGTEPSGLFLVASGQVRVVGRDDDGDALQLAQLGPGDVVGEMSLVLRRPASADVIASSATVALELTRERFQDAIRAHPQLLSELYDLATKRDDEMRSIVGQEALDAEEVVLL
jgi:cAMP-dependent protein kinase regulator